MIGRRRMGRAELLPADAIDGLRAELRRERRRTFGWVLPVLTSEELEALSAVVREGGAEGLVLSSGEAEWFRRLQRRARLRVRFGFGSPDEEARLVEVSLGADGAILERQPVLVVGKHRVGPVSCVAGVAGCFCVDVALEVPAAVRAGRGGVLEEAARWHGLLMSGREWREAMGRAARRVEVGRAALALDLLPRLEEEARERSLANLKRGTEVPERPESDGRADSKAAALVGVGRTTVAAAKQIERHDPDGVRVEPKAESQGAEVSEPPDVEVDVNGNPVAFGPAAFAEDLGGRPEPGSAAWVREYRF